MTGGEASHGRIKGVPTRSGGFESRPGHSQANATEANATGKEGKVYPSDGTNGVTVTAPGPDTCPVCATKHDRTEPHDRNSLYYQHRFHRTHKRFPTWKDAMAHCSEATRAAWRDRLIAQGVSPEEFADDEAE